MNLNGAQALFISCTALPALSILEKLENKLGIFVFSSNQTLIWDTLKKTTKKQPRSNQKATYQISTNSQTKDVWIKN